MATFPREGQGFRAEVKLGDKVHLILVAVHTGLGPGWAIFDAGQEKWFREREWTDDIEDAKQKAESRARKYCSAVDSKLAFPAVVWTPTG
jgi:hypothetical protein